MCPCSISSRKLRGRSALEPLPQDLKKERAPERAEDGLQVLFGEGRRWWRRGLEGCLGDGEQVMDRFVGREPRRLEAERRGGQQLIGSMDAGELLGRQL